MGEMSNIKDRIQNDQRVKLSNFLHDNKINIVFLCHISSVIAERFIQVVDLRTR